MWRRATDQFPQVYWNKPGHEVSDDDEGDEFEPVTYDNSCSERLMSLYAQKKEKGEIAAPAELVTSQAIHADTKRGDYGLEEFEGEVTVPPLSRTSQVLGIDAQKGNAIEEPVSENSSEDDIEMEHEHGFRRLPPRNEKGAQIGIESSFSLSNHIVDAEHEDSVWSAIAKEANSLVCLREKKSSSSSFAQHQTKRLQKGRAKRKHKLSFNFQCQKKDCSTADATVGGIFELSAAIKAACHEPSFAERFEEFQHEVTGHDVGQFPTEADGGETILKSQRFKKGDGRKSVSSWKSSHLGCRVLDNEECLEFLVSNSSDDEANVEKRNQLILAPGEASDRAMIDIFQEAFSGVVGIAEVDMFKPKGIGFCERLQRVIQREKENQTRFLLALQTGESSLDESVHVYAKILSRSFDGKFTVCQCLIGDKIKLLNCRSLEEGTEKTIIFQPKVSANVELEVGNVIQLHPPWKEVQVAEDEGIMLCMYFSQAAA